MSIEYVNFLNLNLARVRQSMTPATSLFSSVEADLRILADNLIQLVGNDDPILYAAAQHLFGAGGKRIRPAIVLLISRATMLDKDITPRHRRLAEITEMIHTASLVHDDVVDEADLRRGVPTIHSVFGNRKAVLAGDFFFAQSSWHLANLDNLEVVKLLSQVLMDFAVGEIQQGRSRFSTEITLETYLQKSYYKTASLIANSAKAASVLSEVDKEIADKMYGYGNHFGLAFQIVDDILDFTSSSDVLGKPAGSDLKSGHLTAPVLYALEEQPKLEVFIEREFAQEGDLEQAMTLIENTKGIQRARELAEIHAKLAVEHANILSPSESRQALISMADYVLSRLY